MPVMKAELQSLARLAGSRADQVKLHSKTMILSTTADVSGLQCISIGVRGDLRFYGPYQWSMPWSKNWVAARLSVTTVDGCAIEGPPTTEIVGGARYLWSGPTLVPTTWVYRKKHPKCSCGVECAQFRVDMVTGIVLAILATCATGAALYFVRREKVRRGGPISQQRKG
jgi:hypothetical protein